MGEEVKKFAKRLHDEGIFDQDYKNEFLKNGDFRNVCWLLPPVFDESNLTNALFEGAAIRAAKFRNCEMPGSDFKEVRLHKVDFSGSNANSGNFKGAILKATVFKQTGLKYADISGNKLLETENVDFEKANMQFCNLSGRMYRDCSFAGTDLRHARFTRASLRFVTFANAWVSDMKLDGAALMNVDFRGAKGITEKLLEKAAVIFRVKFDNNVWKNLSAGLRKKIKTFPENLSGIDLKDLQIYKKKITDCSMENCDLRHTRISESKLTNTSFKNAMLFWCSVVENTVFNYPDFSKASFSGSFINKSEFSNANFNGARIYTTMMESSRLKSADFTKAKISNSYIQRCDLTGSVFYKAEAKMVIFYQSKLGNSDCRKADFSSSTFFDCDFERTDLGGSLMVGAFLKVIDLTSANIKGVDFSFACLKDVNVSVEQLIQVKSLYGAHLDDSLKKAVQAVSPGLFEKPRRLKLYKKEKADIARIKSAHDSYFSEGVDLSNMDLRWIDLTDLNINKKNWDSDIWEGENDLTIEICYSNLAGAVMRNCCLDSARFFETILTGAQMQGASLVNAKFNGAVCYEINLQCADLRAAEFCGSDRMGYKSFRNVNPADMRNAILRKADLRDTNFTGVNLSSADLRDSDLTGACLKGAILRGARLDGAVLDGADFTDADMRGFDWGGSVFEALRKTKSIAGIKTVSHMQAVLLSMVHCNNFEQETPDTDSDSNPA